MHQGNIIFLNGVSSSGKSTLARGLIQRLPGYFQFGSDLYDELIEKMEDRENGRLIPVDTEVFIHRTIRMFSDCGVNLVVDHILHNEPTLQDFQQTLAGYPILLVGVHCPLAVLEQRERERGDRWLGLAASQLEFVHKQLQYDLEINTHLDSLEDNLERICAAVRDFERRRKA